MRARKRLVLPRPVTQRHLPREPNPAVSHFWGEPVLEFIACIEQHSADRALGLGCKYWGALSHKLREIVSVCVRLALASVCAYANNQWDLGGDVTNDPANSSFWRALDQAEGMISVIDKNAICFTRVWARRPQIEHARALPAPVLD